MHNQIENSKGKKLYMLTIVCTNDIQPIIIVDTWKGCINRFNQHTLEINSDVLFMQLIHKEIKEDNKFAKAYMRCNRKGSESDYFKYITIEPLYTDAW